MTLDRLFDRRFTAVDLFTDRVPENEAFHDAVLRHLERVVDGTAVLDEPVRRNVLTFYGIGGVGKTELSRRLERWLHGELPPDTDWGAPPALDHPVCTARIDFHGSRVVSAVDVVLSLRAAVAARGRRFPAFDLGLAAWWSLARPGTALPQLKTSTGFDVHGQIMDTLSDAIADAGAQLGLGPLSVRTGIMLVDAIRSRRLSNRMLRDCHALEAIVEAASRDASSEVASYLPGLLSWDLERLVRGSRPLVVAFADAVEYVQGGDREQERLLNRIVHLTPGVLWTVTSRRSLDWADPALFGVLPEVGASVWPGLSLLSTAEPRQHLVGDLADEDVLRYLARASGAGGNPVLGADVTERIRRGAHGLPLYLDLSLAIARSAGPGALDPGTFGGPLPALVTRVFADLPDEERAIARTASLLPRFDTRLLASAARRLEGDAQRFCTRALVRGDAHPVFPYRLHDAVRAALAKESVSSPGAFTAADRLDCARALLDVLRQRHDEVIEDVDRRLDVLELAAGLSAEHDLEVPWLATALVELPGMGRTAERLPPPDTRTWMGQLSRFFDAWRGKHTDERIRHLEQLLATPLPADITRRAKVFLAYSIRVSGDPGRALTLLRELLAAEPDSSVLRYQVGRTLHTLCRYDDLDRLLRETPPTVPTELQRLRSDLAFERGDLDEAIAGTVSRAAFLNDQGQHRIALENTTAVTWRSALARRITTAECDTVIAQCDRFGMHLQMRTSVAAKAVCLLGDDAAVIAALDEANAIIQAVSGRPGWREWTVELLLGLHRGDADRIARVRGSWLRRAPACTPNTRLVDRLFRHAGYPATFPSLTAAGGVDPEQRWTDIITALAGPPRTP
ncbi:hypothetical protein OHA72_58035 [Dactylosporangium sp. NBC_01737]|uniref:hypothetical protein n=1 Tax=Dactylosporangium sp. NBC_01737 TaxID=2975959 RepID=UPI002E1282C0|nr:hypothetical protein OHA72_58035 [Dactylosporangium sp. NBC_01737]